MAVQQDSLTERDHKRVARYIEQTAGIQLPESKRSLIEGRLRKRQRTRGMSSLRDYLNFVFDSAEGEEERVFLLDAITTNKTDFYREPDHFKILRRHIEQNLAPHRKQGWSRPLRLWSAGCSSGEEPYTLAMEMLEVQRQYSTFNFDILATDISVSCLTMAKNATYPHARIEPVSMELRRRYLLRSKDNSRDLVRIAPEVRRYVGFEEFNLLTDLYDFKHKFDVIFCRNVMIYFNNEDRGQICQRFSNALVEGGLLFIGHSESLMDRDTNFRQISPTVYTNQTGRKY